MITQLIVLVAFMALFVVFGLLRPADREDAGCHGCSNSDGPTECGVSCPLLRDLQNELGVTSDERA
jgi:hypothetical protein